MNREIELIRKAQAEGKISPDQADMLIKTLYGSKTGTGRMPIRVGILISGIFVGATILITTLLLHAPKSQGQTPSLPEFKETSISQDHITDTLRKRSTGKRYRFVELPVDSVVGQGEMLVMMAGKKLSLPECKR